MRVGKLEDELRGIFTYRSARPRKLSVIEELLRQDGYKMLRVGDAREDGDELWTGVRWKTWNRELDHPATLEGSGITRRRLGPGSIGREKCQTCQTRLEFKRLADWCPTCRVVIP